MGFTNVEQLRELFLCGGMGFLLGAYYDVFRLLRLLLPSPAAVVFAEDCVFFTTSAGAVFLFALAVTDGVLRIYLFVGLAAGFFAYRCTVGRTLLRLISRLVRFLRKVSRRLTGQIRRGVVRLGERTAIGGKKREKIEKRS